MYRLIFDARTVAHEFTGLGRYTACLLFALLEQADPHRCEIEVLLDNSIRRQKNTFLIRINRYVDEGYCRIHFLSAPAVSLRQQWVVPRFVNKLDGDHYFYPHFDLPLAVRIPSTFVVHDLFPVVVDEYFQRMAWAKKIYFGKMLRLSSRLAHRCVAVSETTKCDLLRFLGGTFSSKVAVAPEGPTLSSSALDFSKLGKYVGNNQRFLLYVGDRRPHKNLRRVIDLYKTMRTGYGYDGALFLVGSTKSFDFDVDEYISNEPYIYCVGNVSDPELAAMYSHADALVFLSHYEGFGLPVLEATRFGCRLLLSDGGSLPEVAPASACILPNSMPLDDAARRAMSHLLGSKLPTNDAYWRKYSWSNAAKIIFPMCVSK
jgi:glycosyltransferase involved in cell wall biosynthesis